MRILWAIARNAFAELTRQPVYGILVLVCMALIAFSPLIAMFTYMQDVKLVVDMGLGTIFMMGMALAVLCATQVVSREIEAKTAGAVMSKPVGRLTFVAGKFLGVTMAMALAGYLFTLMLLVTVRIDVPVAADYVMDKPAFLTALLPFLAAIGLGLHANYFYRWNFTSTAVVAAVPLYTVAFLASCFIDSQWQLDLIATTYLVKDCDQIVRAAILVFLGVWVISSVAVAASTRVNVVANVLICGTVFFVGMVSQYLFGWTVDNSWVLWEPTEDGDKVVVSGLVLAQDGAPMPGVRLLGAPGRPRTGPQGRYEFEIKEGSTGSVTPQKHGFVFQPATRSYMDVVADRAHQDYGAVAEEGGGALDLNRAWTGTAWVAYHVLPSVQLFWVADQLIRPNPFIPYSYVGKAALYAAMWCAAMVTFGTFLFEGREVA